MKKKSFIYPIIFMSAITAVFTFILAYLNYSTAERIEFLQDTDLRKKILYVFDIPVSSNSPEDIEAVFSEYIKEDDTTEPSVFYILENGEISGYAIPVDGAGLWGSIEGYIGVSSDFTKLLGLEFTSHSETPGLGGRISEPEFLEQFRGLDISTPKGDDYIIYKPAPGGNADAISGATLTSKSVSDLLNIDIHRFINERKGD